jgi:uncharacterized protein YcgI (DUF1989 family)
MTARPLGRELVQIPARHGAALERPRGLILRVTDVEGQRGGDAVFLDRGDLGERDCPRNTGLFSRMIDPAAGAARVSDRGRSLYEPDPGAGEASF